MSSRKRRTFSDEFKKGAVQLFEDKGYSLKEASDSLGVSQNCLCNWHKKFGKALPPMILRRRIELFVKKSSGFTKNVKS